MKIIIITEVSDVCHLMINIPQLWNVRSEQYIYLRFPTVSFLLFWQSHSFMIIWWNETKDKSSKLTSLKLLILVQSKGGLSKYLYQLSHYKLSTLIEDSYRESNNFSAFSTCLIFATEIDIASILPHIKAVVNEYRRFKICMRQIVLVWQIKQESKFWCSVICSDSHAQH